MRTNITNEKILCVDDEPHILDAFKRQLRGDFEITVTDSPARALEQIKSGEKFAVIVSDMRMPGINGTTLLKTVREVAPDTVRVMLTGNMDQETATQAVNEGKIFRFVNKPCSSDELAQVLKEALEYHRTLRAERDLLQNTLAGSVRALTDILSLSDPIAFGSGAKLRQSAKEIAGTLDYPNLWEIELATMLSGIGWITIPDEVKARFRSGQMLKPAELLLIESVPQVGSTVIKAIPRLSGVAKIIEYSMKNFDGSGVPVDKVKGDQIPLGARILVLVRALSDMESQGIPHHRGLIELQKKPAMYDSQLIAQLIAQSTKSQPTLCEIPRYEITARELCVGHRLMEKLECSDGRLLLTAGTYVSELLRTSILNYSENIGLRGPIVVDARIPSKSQSN